VFIEHSLPDARPDFYSRRTVPNRTPVPATAKFLASPPSACKADRPGRAWWLASLRRQPPASGAGHLPKPDTSPAFPLYPSKWLLSVQQAAATRAVGLQTSDKRSAEGRRGVVRRWWGRA